MDESRRAETAEHPCRGRDDIPLLLVKGLSVTFTQYDRGLRRKLLHPITDLSLQVRRGGGYSPCRRKRLGKEPLSPRSAGDSSLQCCVQREYGISGGTADREET